MKTIVVFLTSIIVNISFSQSERTSAEPPKIQSTTTKVLSKAKGYSLNENGQWVSGQNKIPYPNSTNSEIDNFVSYDLRDITIKDTLYTLFMKKYNTGWHTYPALMEGWNSTINAEWFVIEKHQIDSLKLKTDTINYVVFTPKFHGWVDNAALHKKWNNSTYIADIQNSILKSIAQKEGQKMSLVLHIAPYVSKNIVRFNFYSMSYLYPSMITANYEPKDPKGKYSFQTLKIFGTNTLFDYCYFETDLISFEKLIAIK